jgi:hypothetical protein
MARAFCLLLGFIGAYLGRDSRVRLPIENPAEGRRVAIERQRQREREREVAKRGAEARNGSQARDKPRI